MGRWLGLRYQAGIPYHWEGLKSNYIAVSYSQDKDTIINTAENILPGQSLSSLTGFTGR